MHFSFYFIIGKTTQISCHLIHQSNFKFYFFFNLKKKNLICAHIIVQTFFFYFHGAQYFHDTLKF